MPKAASRKSGNLRPVTQVEKRQSIDVGSSMNQVSPVAYWFQNCHFQNEDEARGAFRLAYLQGLDGMGTSIQEWMGLNEKEFDDWMRNDGLPKL